MFNLHTRACGWLLRAMEQRELVSARLLFVSLLDHSQGIDLSEMDWAHNLQMSWKTDTTSYHSNFVSKCADKKGAIIADISTHVYCGSPVVSGMVDWDEMCEQMFCVGTDEPTYSNAQMYLRVLSIFTPLAQISFRVSL